MTVPQRIVLLLLAFSLIAGLATGSAIYYRLSYFWAILFGGGWAWSRFALKGISLRRSARTTRAQVGQIFEERYEVINESRVPKIWFEVKNESPLPDSGGSQVLTLLGGRQRRIYWSQTFLKHRGVFPLGPTVMASGDLFGLFPVSMTQPVRESLLVYPLMFHIHSFPNPAGLLPGGEALRRRTHQVTPNAAGVREYVHGDAMNRIHWASTARRNRLIVKEFELDPLAEVWLFLDSERFGQAALPEEAQETNLLTYWRKPVSFHLPPSTEEYGVSITASLASYFIRRGRSVGLVNAGRHLTLLSPDRGGRQLGKILEALALSHAEGSVPMRGLVETQAKHITRGSTVILITHTAREEFPYIVEYLLRRGVRPVVVLIDPTSFGGVKSNREIAEKVRALSIPVLIIENGVNLEVALGQNRLASAPMQLV
jgi:uncharacterized protein (DUF58 family)